MVATAQAAPAGGHRQWPVHKTAPLFSILVVFYRLFFLGGRQRGQEALEFIDKKAAKNCYRTRYRSTGEVIIGRCRNWKSVNGVGVGVGVRVGRRPRVFFLYK